MTNCTSELVTLQRRRQTYCRVFKCHCPWFTKKSGSTAVLNVSLVFPQINDRHPSFSAWFTA